MALPRSGRATDPSGDATGGARRWNGKTTRRRSLLSRVGPHSVAYAAVLAAALVAVIPAVQLARTARVQRVAAERALRDKMLDAAGMLADGLLSHREMIATGQLAPVYGAIVRPGDARLSLTELATRSGQDMRAYVSASDPWRGYFRFDAGARHPSLDEVEAVGAMRNRRVLREVLDEAGFAPGRDSLNPAGILLTGVIVDSTEVFVAVAAERRLDGTPVAVFGATYSRAVVEQEIIAGLLKSMPLLTSTFEGVNWRTAALESAPRDTGVLRSSPRRTDTEFNKLLLVDVVGYKDEPIYRTTGEPASAWRTPWIGEFDLAKPYRVTVRVGLPREHGERLVAAASSRRNQRWLLVGVTLLGLGFVVAVFVEVRRQRQLAEARRSFVSAISHELRTPLAHMAALSETLLVGGAESPEQERRWLAAIQREAHRLGRLVENVLLHSLGERAPLPVERTWVDLAEIVEDVVASADAVARARGVSVTSVVPPASDAYVDAGALRQILLNLVDNAIKYGPERQTVTVTVRPPMRPADPLRILVDDEGTGVPEAHRARVWEAFERVDDRGGATGGSGLGLSVVQALVAAHEGRAWVTDAPGGGARFAIEIPQPADA